MVDKKDLLVRGSYPVANAKRRSILISLSTADYRRACVAARSTKQTVAAWIADMVNTSTQP